jgi:hypothetical protein
MEKLAMLTRCVIRALLCLAAIPSLSDEPMRALDRVYLTKTDIEQTLIGKGIVSKNLASGMVSHWEFRADGSVHFANRSGPGSASGTWTLREDGLMCVTMVSRTRCRYWFREGGAVANSNTNEPNAATVAEVRVE